MELLKSINLRYYEIKDKLYVLFVDVKPRKIRIHRNSDPVLFYEWMHTEQWTLFEEKLAEIFVSNEDIDCPKKIALSNNIEATVKNRKQAFEKHFKELLAETKPKPVKIKSILKCSLKYNESTHYKENHSKTSEEEEPFEGFAENAQNGNISSHEEENEAIEIKNQPISDSEEITNGDMNDNDLGLEPLSPPSGKVIKQEENGALNSSQDSEIPCSEDETNKASGSLSNTCTSEETDTKLTPKKHRKKRNEAESLIDSLSKDLNLVGKREKRPPCYKDYDLYFFTPRSEKKAKSKSNSRKKSTDEIFANESEALGNNDESDAIKTKIKPARSSDLFAIDEDMDVDFQNQVTKKEEKANTPTTSNKRVSPKTDSSHTAKKRRKQVFNVVETSDFEIEKKSMNNWLEKKGSKSGNSSSTPVPGKKENSSTKTTPKTPKTSKKPEKNDKQIVYPSKEEMAEQRKRDMEQIEENKRIKKILDELAGPPPKKVETLTLHEMSLDDIIGTFKDHKEKLDKIFDREKHKDIVRGSQGVNHYLVMSLVDSSKQLKIMETLSDIYEANIGRSSAFATLFANAMMPEWLLGIFMKKFNFTREEAITHLKDEEKYRLYLESKDEQSLKFD